MGKIAGILQTKGSTVHSIEPDATVFDAIRKMVECKVGSLLVMDGNNVVGIMTERDYLRRLALEGKTSRNTPVREIMSERVICVTSDADVEECMALMTGKRIRHLPVVEGGRLLGLVSIGDLVKDVSKRQEYQISYLTDYISGKYPG